MLKGIFKNAAAVGCGIFLSGCTAFIPKVPEYTGTAPQVHGVRGVPLFTSWSITYSRIVGDLPLYRQDFEILDVLHEGRSDWTIKAPHVQRMSTCGVQPEAFRATFASVRDSWMAEFKKQVTFTENSLGTSVVHYTSFVVPGNCSMVGAFLLHDAHADEASLTFMLPVLNAGEWHEAGFDALSNFSHEIWHSFSYRMHILGKPMAVEETRAYLFQRCAELAMGHDVASPWAKLDLDENWYIEHLDVDLSDILGLIRENHPSIQGMALAQLLTWRWVGEGPIVPQSERAEVMMAHCRSLRESVPDVK